MILRDFETMSPGLIKNPWKRSLEVTFQIVIKAGVIDGSEDF